jgi:hypothetical protein
MKQVQFKEMYPKSRVSFTQGTAINNHTAGYMGTFRTAANIPKAGYYIHNTQQ